MKEYVKLTVDAEAYWSGNTYFEEVFLPLNVWDEIKNNFEAHVYLTEFDGKHSEVKAGIEIEEANEKELALRPKKYDDGETLFYHIYEYLDEDKYDNEYLLKIQEEVESLCQVETLTIKINKQAKDEVLKLLEGYLL